ncbi:Aerobic cobaltochelatase subunit CobN [Pseudovibrio axinellae]|uniref:Cobaltochelatase subunit CobN n=1 Tax=Pseudovibrio axinellae TaxID=989403 RepID=A0A166B136_9HYPH|nr:cobaltochelatase subunit CobN [Pseudovibrio axinellae]KZL21804.1 Aerobic cobaltochelatase subunit CobN [Pseudovibrio axinellae]SEQ79196.1 cobaltochelatase CobN subunit [Pseudovibrio axinellae]
MHLLVGQSRRLDEGEEAVDLGQTPADVVFLSAADTELAGLASAHAQHDGYSLRLASFLALSHPYSVDLYAEQTIQASKLVVVRLLGGVEYWRYGVERLEAIARADGVKLVLLPGDDKWDEELAARSTVPLPVAHLLWRYLIEGGAENLSSALLYAAHITGLPVEAPAEPTPLPRAGLVLQGHTLPSLDDVRASWSDPNRPVAAIVFYRALYQSGAIEPVQALCHELEAQGINPLVIYVASLKQAECAAVVSNVFDQCPPDIVLNATAFALSNAGSVHSGTVLDKNGACVLQIVLSSSSEEGWSDSDQGLSPRDLAMHVVLPEIDGRLLTRAISFKEEGGQDPKTQCPLVRFVPKPDRVRFVAELAANWALLRRKNANQRKVGVILANYPNKDGRIANGVGLDTPASCTLLLSEMKSAGYEVDAGAPQSSQALIDDLLSGPTNALDATKPRKGGEELPVSRYKYLFSKLPLAVQQGVIERWGEPEADPHIADGCFQLALKTYGNVTVGIQPARGYNIDPKETYHDPALVPPHHYLAWYMWLRDSYDADALIHLGKHGNLEWLPGKALALSEACYPEAVIGPLPNIYPFIVNDPGEGSQAKRRLSSVIIDHLTPPLARAESHGSALELEALLDEYYIAAGVDHRRLKALGKEILGVAAREGMDKDIGLTSDMDEDTRLARLDAYLCDLKELQIRDGLHILGLSPTAGQRSELLVALLRVPRGEKPHEISLLRTISEDLNLVGFDPLDCAFEQPWTGERSMLLDGLVQAPWRSCGDTVERLEALALAFVSGEMQVPAGFTATYAVLEALEQDIAPAVDASGTAEVEGVLSSLAGQFVPPGPSGAPSRGRPDVLPTGRNFYSIDVRAVPTKVAWKLGEKSASALIMRHFQDHGEWLQSIAMSCWGTANMRTGGDDIAQALALIGARPVWEEASGRVTGFKVVPLAELQRPRVDVTLRISGFFRDAFPQLIHLFDAAVAAIAELDEPEDANPLAARFKAEFASLLAKGVEEGQAHKRASSRIFGSKPGAYGAGLQAMIDEKLWDKRSDFAESFLEWGGYAYGRSQDGDLAKDDLKTRLLHTDAVVHNQDNREHDLLDSDDYYQFEGGLAATVETLKESAPHIYHNDHSRPERPVIRMLSEEIGRVVRGRAANPKWIAGVMRHGYKGAFEMAATLDYLFAFSATTNAVSNHHFDQLYDAYLYDDEVREFIADKNSAALLEMTERFLEVIQRDMWVPRRNSAFDDLLELRHALMDGGE